MAHDINTEEDLECIMKSINATVAEDNDYSLPAIISPYSQPEPELLFSYHHESLPDSSPPSSPVFSTLTDPYIDDISQPIPDGTYIFGHESRPLQTMKCVVCGKLTSGGHSCPGCNGNIHVICGRTNGEEGYGTTVWCPRCDISLKSSEADSLRAGIKRSQNKLHNRMLQSSAKKFHPACVGDNVIIPIERPDRMTSLGQRNLIGVVTGVGVTTIPLGLETAS